MRPDKLKEECGVFGIYDMDGHDVARLSYYGLYALQHRGEESAGIAVNDKGSIIYHKDMGLVAEVFDDVVLNHLKGKAAIGHVRYSTTGGSMRENAQPMVIKSKRGQMALAHNGNLVNQNELRERLEEEGAVFQTTTDTEVILNLIPRFGIVSDSIEETLTKVIEQIKGSFGLVILADNKLIGIRDPLGIRPLCIGKAGNSYILASESCALDAVGAAFIRDVNPGEIVLIDENGLKSVQTLVPEKSGLCIFEFVYFARPDSCIDGASVYQARLEAGRRLAIEHMADADIVIGVPDSGLIAALGFSIQSGIPYGQGLLKNRYVGRTFIQPDQGQREEGVRIKHNSIRSSIDGKRVILVEDSVVRGTTMKRIVNILREAGAKEVHLRISSPPYMHPCYFGIDTPSRKDLLASSNSVDEICKAIGADTIGYLSLEGLLKTPVGSKCSFCTACFTGTYPMEVPKEGSKYFCGRID